MQVFLSDSQWSSLVGRRFEKLDPLIHWNLLTLIESCDVYKFKCKLLILVQLSLG